MKPVLFMILFLILTTFLSAFTWKTDDCIELVMMFGHFQEIQSVPCFVSQYFDADEFPSRDIAIGYLADTGSVFAIVQKNLDTYISTPDTDKMKDVEVLACPFSKGDRDYLAVIELDYILAEFGKSQLANLTQNQQIEFCEKIVNAHVIIEDITLDFDE